jgi:hypothetical protein
MPSLIAHLELRHMRRVLVQQRRPRVAPQQLLNAPQPRQLVTAGRAQLRLIDETHDVRRYVHSSLAHEETRSSGRRAPSTSRAGPRGHVTSAMTFGRPTFEGRVPLAPLSWGPRARCTAVWFVLVLGGPGLGKGHSVWQASSVIWDTVRGIYRPCGVPLTPEAGSRRCSSSFMNIGDVCGLGVVSSLAHERSGKTPV